MSDTLDVPGLPRLTWERKTGWRCDLRLSEWADLAPETDESDAGEVTVTFACPDVYARNPPTAPQAEAFQLLKAQAATLRAALLQATFDEFAETLNQTPWVVQTLGGPLKTPETLAGRIAVDSVTIQLEEAEDEPAEISLDLDGFWDPEHGFHATIREGRFVEVETY